MRGGFKHDRAGRSTGKPRDRRVAAVLGLPKGVGFSAPVPRDVLDSAAFIALSRLSPNGLRFLLAVLAEHTRNGGYANGELAAPYDDLVKRGIRRGSIRQAIADTEAVGLIRVTFRGRLAHGVARRPSRYALTWLGIASEEEGTFGPSNDWREVATIEEGEHLILSSRTSAKVGDGEGFKEISPVTKLALAQ